VYAAHTNDAENRNGENDEAENDGFGGEKNGGDVCCLEVERKRFSTCGGYGDESVVVSDEHAAAPEKENGGSDVGAQPRSDTRAKNCEDEANDVMQAQPDEMSRKFNARQEAAHGAAAAFGRMNSKKRLMTRSFVSTRQPKVTG
jgi:hypothetical protein